jgi:uncharacterized protein YhfF
MTLPPQYADAVTFSFGDSPELNDELLALVLSGKKTATCGALRDFGADGEELPIVGRRDVVLDSNGDPACAIETVEVTIRRFDEVTAEFAAAEGEGDQSFDSWKASHKRYFARTGGFSYDMKLVCERFKVIEVFEPQDDEDEGEDEGDAEE